MEMRIHTYIIICAIRLEQWSLYNKQTNKKNIELLSRICLLLSCKRQWFLIFFAWLCVHVFFVLLLFVQVSRSK